ncbi:BRCT domain-containing protein [Vogesella sp. AC12]|uniref:BRCT domain-containing protein n=1 Tax=Vogesella sp. AC12 TaxID=2950550 RepID=UPI00210D1C91|nr:BRCT domain-containing protein [Vogesella sp. AC12]
MHYDHKSYLPFTGRSRLDKSINSLIGIVEGIAIDQEINAREVRFLQDWVSEHAELQGRHPYNELMPVVMAALEDGVLTADERDDILWLCNQLRSTGYYDEVTADLQRLHALLGAILADGVITEAELRGLSAWMADHEHLKRCWPYDEIDSLIVTVMADKKIDEQEQKMLRSFFAEFIGFLDNTTIVSPMVEARGEISGLCSVCPEVVFQGAKFCFTGASSRYKRTEIAEIVQGLGGEVVNDVSSRVDYLVIGADGNPCWAYACYGRKVEKAVQLRKKGAHILLVHENDFHDAVADA